MNIIFIAEPARPAAPSPRYGGWGTTVVAIGYTAVLGLLLASFPARNTDVWLHLAAGRRAIIAADFGVTWLYDTITYVMYSGLGGRGLVAAKAGLVSILSGLLAVISRTPGGGWRLPLACTVLTVLAVSSRALLQPTTLSYLMLALIVWYLRREGDREETTGRVGCGWPLVPLFVLWTNLDRWVMLGLLAVTLTWLGRGIDRRVTGYRWPDVLRRAIAVGVLLAAVTVSPTHVRGLCPPPELIGDPPTWAAAVGPGDRTIASPFTREYLSGFGGSPATLAYYPLLGLGAVSFVLTLRRWRWERFLPWVALAVASGLNVRVVPAFAVIAGPILAWNLHDYFQRRPRPTSGSRLAPALIAVLGLAFLTSAWTGWLQGPPYGARRWAFELPGGIETAAATVRGWHADGILPPGSKSVHLSPDTAAGFGWFCPDDPVVTDDRLIDSLGTDQADVLFRAAGVDRLVAYVADRRLRAGALERVLDDPDQWRLLHLTGGVAMFGRREVARPAADPYRGLEVNFERLGYHPGDAEKAPPHGPGPVPVPRWSDPFLRPAVARSAERDEAALLLLKAEALRRAAPVRRLTTWEAGHATALVAAVGAWVHSAAAADAAVRLTLFQPQLPADPGDATHLSQPTRLVLALQQGFAVQDGDVSPGVLYATVRAARRAVAANPSDPSSLLILGQSYQRLLGATEERAWAARMPQVARLRQVQACWALSRAVTLSPESALARYELARVYQSLGCHDLAVQHLRAYRDLAARSARSSDNQVVAAGVELEHLTRQLEHQTDEYRTEAERMSVSDRAHAADRRGLAGRALELLLASDLSAFGVPGTKLELDLLLRTGRAHDVQAWTTGTPELRASLGEHYYRWLLVQASAAVGDYVAADAALRGLGVQTVDIQNSDELAAGFARLTGSLALSELAVGPSFPHRAVQSLDVNDFSVGVSEVVHTLRLHADAMALKGLLALEAGDVELARESFSTALRHYGGKAQARGHDFSGRPIAESCLQRLNEASGPPAK